MTAKHFVLFKLIKELHELCGSLNLCIDCPPMPPSLEWTGVCTELGHFTDTSLANMVCRRCPYYKTADAYAARGLVSGPQTAWEKISKILNDHHIDLEKLQQHLNTRGRQFTLKKGVLSTPGCFMMMNLLEAIVHIM